MTMTVKVMELFNKARVNIEDAEKERLHTQKRLSHLLDRAVELRQKEQNRLALLNLTFEALENRISEHALHPEGITLFINEVPGGVERLSKLPDPLKCLVKSPPEENRHDSALPPPEKVPGKKKKRIKFSL